MIKLCECGCKEKTTIYHGKPRRFISGHNMRGPDHFRFRDAKGYWMIYLPGYFSSHKSFVKEHIHFYQECNKLCMLPWGDIHHIDGNKNNNMPWNLKGMTHGQHLSLHKKIDMSDRRCSDPNCKTPTKTYINKAGRPRWFDDGSGGFVCQNHIRKRYK